MIAVSIFSAVSDLFISAKSRRDRAAVEFLEFYRGLVESLPPETCDAFGKMSVSVTEKGSAPKDFGLLLTATDYMFWKRAFDEQTIAFVAGVESVQMDMLERLADRAEKQKLTAEERKALLAILDTATARQA